MSSNRTKVSAIVGGLPTGNEGQILVRDNTAPGGVAFKNVSEVVSTSEADKITDGATQATSVRVASAPVSGFKPIEYSWSGTKHFEVLPAVVAAIPFVYLRGASARNLDIRTPTGFDVYINGSNMKTALAKLSTIDENAKANPARVALATEANPTNTNGSKPLDTYSLSDSLNNSRFDRLSDNPRTMSPKDAVEIVERFGIASLRESISSIPTISGSTGTGAPSNSFGKDTDLFIRY